MKIVKIAPPDKRTFYIEHHVHFGYRLVQVWEPGDEIAFEEVRKLTLESMFKPDVDERIIAEQSVSIKPWAHGGTLDREGRQI